MKELRRLTAMALSITFLATGILGHSTSISASSTILPILTSSVVSLNNKLLQNQQTEINTVTQSLYQQTIDNNIYKQISEKHPDKQNDSRERKEIIVKYKDETIADSVKGGVRSKLMPSKLTVKKKTRFTRTELLEVDDNDDADQLIEEFKKIQMCFMSRKTTSYFPQNFLQTLGLTNNGAYSIEVR